MDTKNRFNPQPQTLSPTKSGRRRRKTTSDDCKSSPEFEFWMVRNPSCPQPNILSADELFVDGVLLPLHLLSTHNKPDPIPKTHHPDPETSASEPPAPDPDPGPEPSPAITDSSAATTTLSASKRWKDIFRKSEKKNAENNNTEENEKDNKEKAKKKERKAGSGGGGATASSAELNINIWPFSRSRSAGNAASRPKLFPGAPVTGKVNSAPCSRSNSAGESKSRKWPSSPGRGGVHLGRSSPVWQVRRGGSASKNPEPPPLIPEKWSTRENSTMGRRSNVPASSSSAGGGGGGKTRVLNLNVPTCIGYRTHLSCRSDVNSAVGSNIRGSNSNGNGHGDDGSNAGGKRFNLRSLFKKSLLTSH